MIGITAYSTYVPRHRLPRELIAAAWGSRGAPGAKAVANFDEDSLTMAQAAVWKLLPAVPDAIYFGSTSAPHWQRSSASLIAAFCDLPAETATADFGGSLRAGTMALRSGARSVLLREARDRTIVVASDTRDGAPESAEEMIFGDAAAAIEVGDQNVIAELIAQVSRSDDFLDEWRRDADRYVVSLASKFSTSRGYEANSVAVGPGIAEEGVACAGEHHARGRGFARWASALERGEGAGHRGRSCRGFAVEGCRSHWSRHAAPVAGRLRSIARNPAT